MIISARPRKQQLGFWPELITAVVGSFVSSKEKDKQRARDQEAQEQSVMGPGYAPSSAGMPVVVSPTMNQTFNPQQQFQINSSGATQTGVPISGAYGNLPYTPGVDPSGLVMAAKEKPVDLTQLMTTGMVVAGILGAAMVLQKGKR